MNDLEAWFEQLPTDEKLILVRKLLEGIESDLAKQAVPPNPKTDKQKKTAPVLSTDLPPLGDLADFNQYFSTKQSTQPSNIATESTQIDLLRLQDAAERFRQLLIRYGYVKSPPSLRDLVRQAQEAERLIAHQNRKRPAWYNWVSKEDEANQPALPSESPNEPEPKS
jgi:hypothetical protein